MRLAAVVLSVCVAGCSVLYVRGPGDGPREYPRCYDASGAIIGDLLVTAAAGTIAVLFARDKADDTNNEDVVTLGLVAGVYGVSSIYGLVQRWRCRAARARTPDRGPYRGFPTEPQPPDRAR